jgi:hypothetical protein
MMRKKNTGADTVSRGLNGTGRREEGLGILSKIEGVGRGRSVKACRYMDRRGRRSTGDNNGP